jgi:hypothetical protein
MKKRFKAPSPALVISLLALFVALGGTSLAANRAIAGKHRDAKADTKLIKKLAPRLSVKHARTASRATTAGSATHATSADSATNATTAADANALQGRAASSFASSAIEAAHFVGATGEPAYENGWSTPIASVDEALSFYKDPWGIVHLQGNTHNGSPSSSKVFTLPVGYRPAKDIYFGVFGAGGTVAFVAVESDGTVAPEVGPAQTFLGLTNVTFRAGL